MTSCVSFLHVKIVYINELKIPKLISINLGNLSEERHRTQRKNKLMNML